MATALHWLGVPRPGVTRGSICGLMLCMPEPTSPAPHPEQQQPIVGSAELARCFAVTGEAIWTLEDCRTVGGVRAGSRSELMCVNCTLTRDRRRPPSTGLLVQGRALRGDRTSVVWVNLTGHGGALPGAMELRGDAAETVTQMAT